MCTIDILYQIYNESGSHADSGSNGTSTNAVQKQNQIEKMFKGDRRHS